jgi:FkbM family methyltransferase
MITNRFDYHSVQGGQAYGVGYEIHESGSYNNPEVKLVLDLLELRRKYFGEGVVALDCGANIGVHTIEWAKHMSGWGNVLSFEAQERIFYALAGNIAINNCFNARAIHCAVAAERGMARIPNPDYLRPASFGSLELKPPAGGSEFIGQPISYSEADLVEVRAITLDSLELPRIDLIKIDVEGMELEVLGGAATSVSKIHPALLVESLKVDKSQLKKWFSDHNYVAFESGLNQLAIHSSDPLLQHVKVPETASDVRENSKPV